MSVGERPLFIHDLRRRNLKDMRANPLFQGVAFVSRANIEFEN